MSSDLRNSLYAWAVVSAMFALAWAIPHIGGRPDALGGKWYSTLSGLLALLGFGRFIWGIWQRRASNPDNPNTRP